MAFPTIGLGNASSLPFSSASTPLRPARERRQRDDHLDGGAVGVGDEPFVLLERSSIHLGDDEGHLRVEPEVTTVVDNDGAARDSLAGELDGGPLLAFRAGEESYVHTFEGLGFSHPDLETLPRQDRSPGAPGHDAQLLHRKVPAPQLRNQPVPYESGPDNGYRIPFAHKFLQENLPET